MDANPINWFRWEFWGSGMSSKLFYNEVPNDMWFRTGGHIDNYEKNLYSFTFADQDIPLNYGHDTTTEEGREAFKKDFEFFCELTPELLNKKDLKFPHEIPPPLTTEPHF